LEFARRQNCKTRTVTRTKRIYCTYLLAIAKKYSTLLSLDTKANMGQVLSPCLSQSATTKAVVITPRTVAGSFSPEQKERTTSVLKDVLPPPLSIAMTKSDSSSKLTEEKPLNEATFPFDESDRASTDVDLPLPEVENMKVEEETSSEDFLFAIDEVSSIKQEVQPLPESTDVPLVLTEALEIPTDETAVEFEVTSEDFAVTNEANFREEAQPVPESTDVPLVLTEALEVPTDETAVEFEVTSEVLAAINEVHFREEAQPVVPESTDALLVLTEAVESSKDENAVNDADASCEVLAAIDEVSTNKEVQHQVDTKDTLSVLTITETVKSPKDEFDVGISSEHSESVGRDMTMLVTNEAEKFSIFDVYEADYNRENSTSPLITTEADVQVPQMNQSKTSLSTNDGSPL
jgi:hypothetical protein